MRPMCGRRLRTERQRLDLPAEIRVGRPRIPPASRRFMQRGVELDLQDEPRPGRCFADEVVVAIPSLGHYKARRLRNGRAGVVQLRSDGVQPAGAGRADRRPFPGLGSGHPALSVDFRRRPLSRRLPPHRPETRRCRLRCIGRSLAPAAAALGLWGLFLRLNLERCLCLGFTAASSSGVASSVKSRGGPPRRSSKLIAMKPGR
jgi:hypothetical protein